ncbi:hypothetical protein D3C71_1883650 [compost metagenome]
MYENANRAVGPLWFDRPVIPVLAVGTALRASRGLDPFARQNTFAFPQAILSMEDAELEHGRRRSGQAIAARVDSVRSDGPVLVRNA